MYETDIFSSTIFKVCATVSDIACVCTGNACCAFQIKEVHNWADEWMQYDHGIIEPQVGKDL